MRKILFIFSLWLAVVTLTAKADTYPMADGGSVGGDIVKFDDNGIMIHTPEDAFTNVPWARFSQDGLKLLSANPKIKQFSDPFILPTEAERAAAPVIEIKEVDKRLKRPADPSLFGGLLKSGVGLFVLFLIYAANLFAAYEISIVKARAAAQVMGVAAVLPIIGPVIFLIMPMWTPPPVVEAAPADPAAPAVPGQKPGEVQIGEASWKPQEEKEKQPEAQVYARGKFTFNKRFIETRFAAYIGAADGEQAKKFGMEVRTMKEVLTIERIAQIGVAEVIFETPKGQVTVQLADIQEIKLNPKTH